LILHFLLFVMFVCKCMKHLKICVEGLYSLQQSTIHLESLLYLILFIAIKLAGLWQFTSIKG